MHGYILSHSQAASATVVTGNAAAQRSSTSGGRCWLSTLPCQPPQRHMSSSNVISTPICICAAWIESRQT